MGKLYYITGNDAQIREKVYCEIFKWSQAQQMHPLKSDPTPEEETPNFYLYDYLGYGEKECFAQLIEQYGDEAVEFIYLRTPEEAESTLFEENIFQSYDPYTNLAQCLQEIVETVFTGYHKTTYNFAAALQAETAQAEDARRTEAEDALQKEKEQKRKAFFQKVVRPTILVVAWALLVCLITVALFHVFTNQTDLEQKGGNLLVVTNPATPTETAGPTTGETLQQDLFHQPMPKDYIIDLLGPVRTSEYEYVGYHINYTSKEQTYHNYFASYGSNIEADYYATSMNGMVGVVLEESSLWYLNRTGTGQVADNVSYCVLSATGNYLFYCCNGAIYCVDTQNNTQKKLLAASDVKGMAASPNGNYCAYLKRDGTIDIINRENKTTKSVVGLKFNTLYTVSNDGGWVCGRSYLDNKNYLLCMGTNGAIKWITDEKTDCYIPFSGENIIYEMMNQIWYSEPTIGYPMQTLPMSGDWRLLFASENCLYEVADGIYMYDESAPFYVLIGDSLFQITYDNSEQEYTTELISQDLLYAEGNVFLQQSDVSTHLLNEIQYVVSATQDGKILYVNKDNELYYYSPGVMAVIELLDPTDYIGEFVRDFSSVKGLTATNGDTLYYYTSSGELWYVKMEDTFFTQKQIETFTGMGPVRFEVNNAGVYLYLHATTNDSIADVYFVQEDTCLFLGTEIGGNAG